MPDLLTPRITSIHPAHLSTIGPHLVRPEVPRRPEPLEPETSSVPEPPPPSASDRLRRVGPRPTFELSVLEALRTNPTLFAVRTPEPAWDALRQVEASPRLSILL